MTSMLRALIFQCHNLGMRLILACLSLSVIASLTGCGESGCGESNVSNTDAGIPTYTECIPGGFEIVDPGSRDNPNATNNAPLFPLHVGTRLGLSQDYNRGEVPYGATYTVLGKTALPSGNTGYRVHFDNPWGKPTPFLRGTRFVGPFLPFVEVYEQTEAGVLLHSSPFLGGDLECPILVAPAEIWPGMVWHTWTGKQVITMSATTGTEGGRFYDIRWKGDGTINDLRRYIVGRGLSILQHSNFLNYGFEGGMVVSTGDLPGLDSDGRAADLSPVSVAGDTTDLGAELKHRFLIRDDGSSLVVGEIPRSPNEDEFDDARCFLQIEDGQASTCSGRVEVDDFFVGLLTANPRSLFDFSADGETLALQLQDDETYGWEDFFARWSNQGDRFFGNGTQQLRAGYVVPLRKSVIDGSMPLLLGTRNGVWAATTLQTPGLNFRKYELQPPGAPALVPGNVSMRETPVGAELLITQSDGLILKLDVDSDGSLRIQRLAHVKVPPGEVALGAFRDGPLETIAGSTLYVLTAPPAASSSIGRFIHPNTLHKVTLAAPSLVTEHPVPIAIERLQRDFALCWPDSLGATLPNQSSWSFVFNSFGVPHIAAGSSPGRECVRINMATSGPTDRAATQVQGMLPNGATIEVSKPETLLPLYLPVDLPLGSGNGYSSVAEWLVDEVGLAYRAIEAHHGALAAALDPSGNGHWALLGGSGFAYTDDSGMTLHEEFIFSTAKIRSVSSDGTLLYCDGSACEQVALDGTRTPLASDTLFILPDGTECTSTQCVRPDTSVVVLGLSISPLAQLFGNWFQIQAPTGRFAVHAFTGEVVANPTCIVAETRDAYGHFWVTYSEECRDGAVASQEELAHHVGLRIPGGVFHMGTYEFSDLNASLIPNLGIVVDMLGIEVGRQSIVLDTFMFGLNANGDQVALPLEPEIPYGVEYRVPVTCEPNPDGCDIRVDITPELACCAGNDLQAACLASGCQSCSLAGDRVVCED